MNTAVAGGAAPPGPGHHRAVHRTDRVAARAGAHRQPLQRQGGGLGRLRRRRELRAGLGPGHGQLRPGPDRAQPLLRGPRDPARRAPVRGRRPHRGLRGHEGHQHLQPHHAHLVPGRGHASGALVPDGHDPARRADSDPLRGQRDAARHEPAGADAERLGDAARDLQRDHEQLELAHGGPAAHAALPVHVRAARRARVRRRPGHHHADAEHHHRAVDHGGHVADRRSQRRDVPPGQDPQVGDLGRPGVPEPRGEQPGGHD